MNNCYREGEETPVKGTKNIFSKIIEENFPNLKEEMPIKVQETNRTLNRQAQKKIPQHIIKQERNITKQGTRKLKRKRTKSHEGRPIRWRPDFS